MVEPTASGALRKGIIIGFMLAILVLGIAVGAPLWWLSTGRDAETFHDGLSGTFRASLAQIVTLEGFAAKYAAFHNSETVTARDQLLKWGERFDRPGPLQNYLDWQHRLELDTELLNMTKSSLDEVDLSNPAARKLIIWEKATASREIEDMRADHARLRECEEAIRQMVADKKIIAAPRCVPVPERPAVPASASSR
jgi:hypothetical protein